MPLQNQALEWWSKAAFLRFAIASSLSLPSKFGGMSLAPNETAAELWLEAIMAGEGVGNIAYGACTLHLVKQRCRRLIVSARVRWF